MGHDGMHIPFLELLKSIISLGHAKPYFADETPVKYSDGDECLNYLQERWSVSNPDRYQIFDDVFAHARLYNDPLHLLACAYAKHCSKASERKEAIKYFEQYEKNPVESKIIPKKTIYWDFAGDYEAEYDFENAEKYYQKSIDCSGVVVFICGTYDLAPGVIKLGRLYVKMGVQRAVEYWAGLKSLPEYGIDNPRYGVRSTVDHWYNDAVDRQRRGYVYKSRKAGKQSEPEHDAQHKGEWP